ncbi:MAG: 50S ribosomal protein L6 [Candidatus Bathyarchaeota archaeon]
MKKRIAREIVKIPQNIDVSIDQHTVSVKGPLGKLERDFSRTPVTIRREGDDIFVEALWADKKKTAMVGTVRSHIKNLILGVMKGFTYKLKIVYAHFPMSVKVMDGEVLIENFGGERKPRKAAVPSTVNVVVSGDDVVISGIDLEKVSQTAASIQQATHIRKRDPRVFLDGVYIYEKGEGI